MIRKLATRQLQPGMYVVDLHRPWLAHSFLRRRFRIRDSAQIVRLIEDGVAEVSIDLDKGLDLPPEEPRLAVIGGGDHRSVQRLAEVKSRPASVSLGEERRRAAPLIVETRAAVTNLIETARAGREVDPGRLEPLVSRMLASVTRNRDALAPLAQVKRGDAYASEHAVATTALLMAFGRQEGLPEPELEKLALGALVKDIGESAIATQLLGKPGTLSPAEYAVIQSHVEEGLAVLQATARLPETAVAVVLEHHERYNGDGYPFRVSGAGISAAGRMASIVDSYDAMTSQRPYRPAISPYVTLGMLYRQGGSLFDPELLAAFIHTVGVYPVGTLVRLESGHLAVVDEIHRDQLLKPVVRVIYHAARRQYVAPVTVDLARSVGNHYGQIVQAESFERWGLSPLRWQPA